MPHRQSRRQVADTEASPSGLLERTLGIIEILSDNAHGLHLFEIADKLCIPRSATHRVLVSLIERGYVRQERNDGAYQLTVKITSLAFTFLAKSGITDFAQPILDRLAGESEELVRLAVISGKDLVWISKSQGSRDGLRYDPDMGQVARLSCSASGHAWLSCLSDEEAISLVNTQGFGTRAKYGPNAPETKSALVRYLHRARQQGFSMVIQTYTPWMSAIAVPIRHRNSGEVTGAVVIAGPTFRFPEQRMLELAPSLLSAANELSLTAASVHDGRVPPEHKQVTTFRPRKV